MNKSLALQTSARAWCTPSTSDKIMDAELAKAFSDILEFETRILEDEIQNLRDRIDELNSIPRGWR